VTATQASAAVASSTAEVQEQVRDAVSRRRAVRIAGGGSWLDANRPVRAELTIATSRLAGIIEYEPGDLTLTARAGTTLDTIARAAEAHGQWLALDPFGDSTAATIGATIATASYGPLAHHFGTPRDMTLGVEFVAGTGDIVRGGGRVVKNVAGYDLTRLVTGSWGSLGVLTEVTVRLRALPAVQATLVLEVGASPEQVEHVRRAVHALPFVPLALEWIDGTLGRRLELSAPGAAILVRLGGNEDAVRAQRTALEALGMAHELPPTVWNRLRVAEPARSVTFRLSRLPSEFAATWSEASRLVARWPGASCHGDPGRGVVRCVLPPSVGEENVRPIIDVPSSGTRIFEQLPPSLWPLVTPAVREPLELRIKAAFDPHGVLNPGILGELQ